MSDSYGDNSYGSSRRDNDNVTNYLFSLKPKPPNNQYV
jgi:hypothetical protein